MELLVDLPSRGNFVHAGPPVQVRTHSFTVMSGWIFCWGSFLAAFLPFRLSILSAFKLLKRGSVKTGFGTSRESNYFMPFF